MANITAAMVKELRDMTGAGMMDCKTALSENDGNMEAAVDWLRAKGLAKAAKKAGRVASEGLIGVVGGAGANKAAMVEVNAETDFVARNDVFQQMVLDIADTALQVGGDVEKLARATYPGTSETVEEHIQAMIGQIGENMALRRATGLEVGSGVVSTYMHSAIKVGLGRIGVLVALESSGDAAKLDSFGRQVAMHIAATNPLALDVSDLDPEVVERERNVLREQARESGKPADIIEKMLEGRIRKFYEESVLLKQTFVIDGENSVEKAVELAAKEIGAPIRIAAFARFGIGEGIEKEETDFAAEVAAAAGG